MIAAPLAGMLLSDMGADVIKIEPPEGESWRLFGQFMPGESRAFIPLNRGKRDIAVDLKSADGQAIVHALVRDADVVLINYRPDVPAKSASITRPSRRSTRGSSTCGTRPSAITVRTHIDRATT